MLGKRYEKQLNNDSLSKDKVPTRTAAGLKKLAANFEARSCDQ